MARRQIQPADVNESRNRIEPAISIIGAGSTVHSGAPDTRSAGRQVLPSGGCRGAPRAAPQNQHWAVPAIARRQFLADNPDTVARPGFVGEPQNLSFLVGFLTCCDEPYAVAYGYEL